MTPFRITWTAREPPLAPCAAWAEGDVAARLVARLLGFDDDRLAALEGVATDRLVLVCGARDALPWVDGIQYLGRHPDAPRLLVPTRDAPSVSPAVLDALITIRTAAILPRPSRIIRLDALRPVSRSVLDKTRVG